ncbi:MULTISPECIES: tRNA lysidine(34) synthetase TilS [unclassified Iodidimonas]|jgi:tRNA(Ile)-lysidine synthase|uniref:tRNA lysidine(34) synthetase TilS n=1 Tax=unclassified Iodidimonas TaxID=2626145 RepID=UPI00248319D4|nr:MULTISPECIES: tRNA lysidine(34) synthetase TilS [unclassified Iodidimonas]
MALDLPLSDAEFAGLMAGFEADRALSQPMRQGVAVGLSGGADSMALMALMARWAAARAIPVRAMSVDHGLRHGSAGELHIVAEQMAALGIPHDILPWRGEKPTRAVQANARAARYRLLEGHCRRLGIGALFLAHHRDDQAETFLLRLARGSGVRGLAAMAPVAPPLSPPHEEATQANSPWRYRPLLAVPKARLVATCVDRGLAWIEDPSNHNPAFDRTAARSLLASHPLPGLNAARLADTAFHLRRADAALAFYTARLARTCVKPAAAGHVILATGRLDEAPDEIILRLLSDLLVHVGGLIHPPRLRPLESLWAQIRAGKFAGQTLAGCLLAPIKGGTPETAGDVLICREPAACAPALDLQPGEQALWDGRFQVALAQNAARGRVMAIGARGWQQIRPFVMDGEGDRLPHPVRLGLPGLWREDRLVAAPFLDFPDAQGGRAQGRFEARLSRPFRVLSL